MQPILNLKQNQFELQLIKSEIKKIITFYNKLDNKYLTLN